MRAGNWEFPDDLLYDTHYQWIRRSGNTIRFGLTPYGVEITGEVLYLSLPEAGTAVGRNESCGSLEAGKWVGRIYAPVSGRILRIHEEAASDPGMVARSPYHCWFAEMELAQPEEIAELMTAAALPAWLETDDDHV